MKARRSLVALAAATLLLLAGCSEPEPPEPVVVDPEVVADKSAAPTAELPDTWPLTGVAGDVLERPALAVKVENSAQARPQAGLAEADIVWEEMVEGGITRFNAVYHSALPEAVGPIRSVRPMDAGIAAPLGGPQVISGGQSLFLREMQDAGVQLISHDGGAAGFYRNSQRRAPHNLFGDPEVFLSQAQADDPPSEQFSFALDASAASAVAAGEAATGLQLSFPRAAPSWTWGADSGAWLRSEGGSPAQTADGERLAASNVVIMRVQIVNSAGRDQSGAPVPETVMTGEGEAVVASGGHTITGTWRKDTLDAPVTLTDGEGNVIELAPGNTWVELVPADRGNVTVER